MTTQEMFSKVYIHLLTQNKKSVSSPDSDNCLYRGPDGTKCAVGCLIEDDVYDSDIEGEPVSSRNVLYYIEESIGRDITYNELQMLNRVQKIHDTMDPATWKEALRVFFNSNNLTIPQL